MFLTIKDLEIRLVDFKEEFAAGVIDLGGEITQKTPLLASGRAQLVQEHEGKHRTISDIRLAGELSTDVELACARCLEPVQQAVRRSFDLLYRPQGADAGRDELSVTAAEAEVSYYQGEGLLLEDALREQVLLALPLKVICREECKGLCRQCGANRNQEACSCAEPQGDARWSPLKEILNKIEP